MDDFDYFPMNVETREYDDGVDDPDIHSVDNGDFVAIVELCVRIYLKWRLAFCCIHCH